MVLISRRVNLQQVANLLRSTQPPTLSGTGNELWTHDVAYGLHGKSLVWLIGVVVGLHAVPRVQLFTTADNGWPHNVPQYH